MNRLPLDGDWQLRLAENDGWRSATVPGCWEAEGIAKQESGPVVYRRTLVVPETWRGRRLWLRFDGVSYHCRVVLDGVEVGSHTGIWDPFRFEVTGLLQPGKTAELRLEVRKPAGLTAGPDSPVLNGPFPLRETLAGFLPYVWGHVFGGPWQSVWLESSAGPAVAEAFARGSADGSYRLGLSLTGEGTVRLRVRAPDGRVVAEHEASGPESELTGRLADPRLWHPDAPACYRLEVLDETGPLASRIFGFRDLERQGTTPTLNGAPVYPRFILNWGWYPDALHANPDPERVREDWTRLKTLGFNGVKFCLWVPPEPLLDLADELGLLVWLELPMWLPRVTEAFLEQVPEEYERIVRRVRSHPSLVIYSLGCELSSEVGAGLLERLYRQTKDLIGDALLRDNSGSGEAYGGLLNEYAEYYDYHFYSELPTFRPLLDLFAPRWRPEQPFLFGEFCDSDTFRDLRRTDAAFGRRPWWARDDPVHNPQGARWQFDIPWQEERLRANGFWERGEELERISRKQALLQRKFTLEAVRGYREIGGYVITGERDTPISTAGVLDDGGETKFAPEAFRAFNADTVLTLGWDRRRAWIHGGDRAAPWDSWGYRSGDRVRAHLILSHYGRGQGRVRVHWRVVRPDGSEVAAGGGESAGAYAPGTLREALIAEFTVPAVTEPLQAALEATAELAGTTVFNRWPLWFFPTRPREDLPAVGLHDPEGVLAGLERLWPLAADRRSASALVCSEWSPEADAYVRAGGRALLLARGRPDDLLPSLGMPFWREAVKVFEAHPAWGAFPHAGWADLQFLACSPDRALDTSRAEDHAPILRRLDARTMALHDYATVLPHGEGRALVTTLRFGGGLGEQPLGFGRSVCSQELLYAWLRWLAEG